MKNTVSSLIFILIGAANFTIAQTSDSQFSNTRRINQRQQESARRFEASKSVSEYNRNIKNWTRATAMQNVSRIYRKPTDKESQLLAVGVDDQKKYADFLRQSETGLTKLIIDRGCAESPGIFNISEECLKYPMPGAGSSFSFRAKNYRINRLSDLTYDAEGFYSSGILAHAIMVNIGDFPLETVSLQTNGVGFLSNFQTVTDFEQARQTDKKISDGIENDGFFYSRNAEAKDDSTYVLRVVAYRGNIYRAMDGFIYDELDFDERRDLTVAFRIVRRDAESVTILWKIISSQKSPAIKKPTREQLKAEEDRMAAEMKKKSGNEN